MVRILGIGDNTVDIYVDRGVQFPGGNAVNVAVHARRLGADAGYLGCLGRDELGDLIWDSLVEETLDLSHLRRIDGPNAWCRIKHTGNDRVFAGSIPGVRGRYDLTEEDDAYIGSFDLVHTSISSDLDGQIGRLSRSARLLTYDYSEHWRHRDVDRTYPHVDIAFMSYPQASDDDCRALMASIAAKGVSRLVVVTRGTLGSCALMDGQFSSEGVRPAHVVDTLGAGDAFIAAFLVSFLEGGDPAAALASGAENAARACGHQGAFGHGHPILPAQPGLAVPPAEG